MSSPAIEQLTEAYLAAHREPANTVPASTLQNLDAASAMAIQHAVALRLGGATAVAKVAAPAGGLAVAAPIIDSWVTRSGGTLALEGRNFLGLEIEIAAVFKRDLTPEVARLGRTAVLEAIDHFIVGIELIGSRIDDRNNAGPFGPLSDCMLTAGYVTGGQPIAALPEVDGLPITLETSAGTTQLGAAKHPFGGVLEPIMAYAAAPIDHFGALRAGMTVTTGSLCPLIEVPATGWVAVRLGDFAAVSVSLA